MPTTTRAIRHLQSARDAAERATRFAALLLALTGCGRDAATPLGPSAPQASLAEQAAAYSCQSSQAQIRVAECRALVALYRQTGGPSWAVSTGWLETATPCSWYGVVCRSNTNSVVALYLGNNGLTGPVPATLGSLDNLQVLYLSFNQLTGSIPAALGSPTNFQAIYLAGNQLTGPIPAAFRSLSHLIFLDLRFNQLTGLVPLPVARVAGLTDALFCSMSDNAGLRMGGGPGYRAADLNHDGYICGLPLPPPS